MLMCAVLVTGCAVGDDYRAELEALPSVDVSHGAEATAIVARELAIDPAAIGSVTWIIGGMRRPNGEPIAGAAIGCDLWVAWWGAWDTSGASSDGPAISYTALAHEVAHCALWLQGDEDATHARADWWGVGGRVERANAALADAGL